MITTYSNSRIHATVPDWPSGKNRVTVAFTVEFDPKRVEARYRPGLL